MTAIKNVKFNDEMQQNAFLFAEQAADRFIDDKDIACFIRSEMKKKYDGLWNCFVTKSDENPEELNEYKSYLCYKFRDCTIHLWSEPSEFDEQSEKQQPEVDVDDVSALIKKYDKSGNGKLEYEEFIQFMKDGLGFEENQNFHKQMRFLYDGMDVDGSHNLDKNEIITCLKKWKSGDFKWITKMIFRGADINNSRKVSIDELKNACGNLGKEFDKNDFENQCKLEFGKKKSEIEYWEFYKIISGETLDKDSIDADPYDGKLPTKSKCCILL